MHIKNNFKFYHFKKIKNGAANFENQMKNFHESNQDEESMTVNIIDNQSEILSEINLSQTNNNRTNIIQNKKRTKSNLNSNFIINTKTSDVNANNTDNLSKNINNKEKFSEITNSEKNQLIKNTSTRKKGLKKAENKEDCFEIPPSRKNTNLINVNKSSNISLNLSEQIDERNKGLGEGNNKKTTLFEKNKNLLILPLNEENPFNKGKEDNRDDDESDNKDEMVINNPELKKLKEEYNTLKEEYNKLKSYMEKNSSIDKNELKEKERLKKKIKKRLKQIKDTFKEKLQY